MNSTALKQIDFEVRRERLHTIESNIDSGRDAILRQDNNYVLGVVSKDYRFIPHIDSVQATIEKLKGLATLNTIRISSQGARIYCDFIVDKKYDIFDGDAVQPKLTMTNSYDGLLKFGFILRALRLVCMNGLMAYRPVGSIRKLHTSGIQVNQIIHTSEKLIEYFETRVIPTWRLYGKRTMNIETVMTDLSKQLGERLVAKVHGKIGEIKEMDAWTLYNHFTEYLTHQYNPKSYDTVIDAEKRVAKYFESVVQ